MTLYGICNRAANSVILGEGDYKELIAASTITSLSVKICTKINPIATAVFTVSLYLINKITTLFFKKIITNNNFNLKFKHLAYELQKVIDFSAALCMGKLITISFSVMSIFAAIILTVPAMMCFNETRRYLHI